MNDNNLKDDVWRGRAAFPPAPPASPALIEAVGKMKPVRTRARLTGFLAVFVVAILWPAFTLLTHPMRRDLAALPLAWVLIGAILWAGSFGLPLAVAMIPSRHQVLPSVGRASLLGLLGMVMLFLFAAFWTAHVPGVSLRPEDLGQTFLESCLACGGYVLQIAAILLLAGFMLIRRVLPVGGRPLGAALGAAGGALAGLALHFHCPVASTAHVLLSHVGAMALACAAGAIIFSALLDR